MAAMDFNELFFNHEIPFCKVYSVESKDKLEKLLLSNRISFCIECQEKGLWERFFHGSSRKNVFTVRINEADSVRARNLVEGIESVKIASA
ncbi:MAG: hypothetical protein LUI12_01280 [Clostridiales bacterium]|nr:hypothetical protein [Clostridiales bacterium]